MLPARFVTVLSVLTPVEYFCAGLELHLIMPDCSYNNNNNNNNNKCTKISRNKSSGQGNHIMESTSAHRQNHPQQ
jgi:hypothetical protein